MILPIKHESIIFANITSDSGTRYPAQQFIWWEAAGRSIMLSSGLLAGKKQTACQRRRVRCARLDA